MPTAASKLRGSPGRVPAESPRSVNRCMPNINATPRTKPTTVGTGARRWMTSGMTSPASAAKTTPAVKCCNVLRSRGVIVRRVARIPPQMVTTMGINMYSQL
jgi:hypothetical protein